MFDVLIVGGGIIGLSIARELSARGRKVGIAERNDRLGREASWAAVGILPPTNRETAIHPYDQLMGWSYQLHAELARTLQDQTGIDTGYRKCGGVYLARKAGEAASLVAMNSELAENKLACEKLTASELADRIPALTHLAESSSIKAAYWVPGEVQLRNPDLVRALVQACKLQGVQFLTSHEVMGFQTSGERISHVVTQQGNVSADQFCVTAGPWSQQLLADLNSPNGVMPIRGQVVMLKTRQAGFQEVINEGYRYLVPREDGRVLVGSTLEEAGFDKSTTPETIQQLCEFAYDMIPALRQAEVERTWSGLRPGTFDGFPYLGGIPQLQNAFAATGHYRAGLYLAPVTGVVISQLICGEQPDVDLAEFRLSRG